VILETIAVFLRNSVKTTWALDLLLLLRHTQNRAWTRAELTAHLRSARTIVDEALNIFLGLKLVTEEAPGAYRYTPSSELEPIVSELVRLYNERPLAIIREIVSAPNDKIQSFVDAFRLKKD